MDKNAIKKFAVWARRELIEKVTKKAMLYGVTSSEVVDADADVVNGMVLSEAQKKERKALIDRVFEKGYEQVMEEVAYTWFNRFCALRFMEVNNYLPSYVRVFTNEDNKFKPQILAEALSLDLDGLDKEVVHRLKLDNKDEELYKYLLITQCNALNAVLPKMFQKIQDYTELLFPDNLLREGSVVERLVSEINEKDWKDTVQIIGWLYQYYNSEPKDEVFARLKKNVKITKYTIPAATQLFTPDWIVRYMVENSLGRIWVEGHPDEDLQSRWKYYLEEAEQEPEVAAKLQEIRKEYADLNPQDIKCIDPCMGSGHILAYMFDVLMDIYRKNGYNDRNAVKEIINNNLFGLDIDKRAAQLAYFEVMMTACKYNRRFLHSGIQPRVYAIVESNNVDRELLKYFGTGLDELNRENAINQLNGLLDCLHDAKEYGSIISVPEYDFELLREYVSEFDAQQNIFASGNMEPLQEKLQDMINVGELLARKYEVVVTNPPYMGASGMGEKLSKYVKAKYPDSKSDLFAVFMEVCQGLTTSKGFQAMITQHSWMFLSSYEKLRKKLCEVDIINMAHLGPRAFEEIGGEVVQTTAFVLNKLAVCGYKGAYCRLIEPTTQQGKEELYLSGSNRYEANQENFSKIPGSPIAYWVSEAFIKAFDNDTISDYGFAGIGMRTGDNERFLRKWYEVNESNMILNCTSRNKQIESYKKWVPYNKGGEYRKWYGNNEYLVNWFNDGFEIKENTKRVYPQLGDNLGWKISNEQYYYKKGITWTGVSSGTFSCRCYEEGFIFDSGANGLFANIVEDRYYLAAFLNTNLSNIILNVMNPTINTGSGTVGKLPLVYSLDYKSVVINIAKKNVIISRSDWDSFETSWDFQKHPMIMNVSRISDAYAKWSDECAERFEQLKANEEELNRIFIDIYGLQDELTPEVEDKEVTVNRFYDSKEAIPESMKGSSYALTKLDAVKSFISYAVGCMFGRYSLDKEGLIYAGGEWDDNNYRVFAADKDAIIPVCDDEYFEDDIVGRFINFVKVVYGESDLEENLQFIADTLGGNGSARDVIRSYFTSSFYADHCKTYQKRPIYWLFDSGKKNGFKCLVYMHRYQKDTIARIRTDYLHEQQARYRTAIADLQAQIAEAATSTRVRVQKQLKKLQEQADEALAYEEKIHHMADQMIGIDLDDGVKHNYEIFKDVLAKIK